MWTVGAPAPAGELRYALDRWRVAGRPSGVGMVRCCVLGRRASRSIWTTNGGAVVAMRRGRVALALELAAARLAARATELRDAGVGDRRPWRGARDLPTAAHAARDESGASTARAIGESCVQGCVRGRCDVAATDEVTDAGSTPGALVDKHLMFRETGGSADALPSRVLDSRERLKGAPTPRRCTRAWWDHLDGRSREELLTTARQWLPVSTRRGRRARADGLVDRERYRQCGATLMRRASAGRRNCQRRSGLERGRLTAAGSAAPRPDARTPDRTGVSRQWRGSLSTGLVRACASSRRALRLS